MCGDFETGKVAVGSVSEENVDRCTALQTLDELAMFFDRRPKGVDVMLQIFRFGDIRLVVPSVVLERRRSWRTPLTRLANRTDCSQRQAWLELRLIDAKCAARGVPWSTMAMTLRTGWDFNQTTRGLAKQEGR